VFHLDVAKVDRDVVHVAMLYTSVFECMFQIFHLFFQTFIASVSSGCCICFTCMLQLFYLDVVYVSNGFQEFLNAFASVSAVLYKCCKCFI
jgi:hypothetical protein